MYQWDHGVKRRRTLSVLPALQSSLSTRVPLICDCYIPQCLVLRFVENAFHTATIIVLVHSDHLPIVIARIELARTFAHPAADLAGEVFVRRGFAALVVTGAHADHEDAKRRDRGGENCKTCFGGGPNSNGGAKP